MGTVDVVFGRVIAIHIKEEVIGSDGKIDVLKVRPIARLGYYDYASVESIFSMIIVGNDQRRMEGMEGSARFSTSITTYCGRPRRVFDRRSSPALPPANPRRSP